MNESGRRGDAPTQQRRAGASRSTLWRVGALVVTATAGYVFVSGAVTSRGSDIRPAGGDIATLLQDRARQVEVKRSTAQSLQDQIDDLSAAVGIPGLDDLLATVEKAAAPAGLTEVRGAGLRVTLTDAPRSSDAEGIDPNVLVVHQQDLQGFVNALWAGGASAVTLQGQRLVSTTGIKCVGSTVVLDGVPYSPPYVIEAIGGPTALQLALDDSSQVEVYREYVRDFDLGLDVESVRQLVAPAWDGQVDLRHAEVFEG